MTATLRSAQPFGPNTAAVRAALDHAAGLLPGEARVLAEMMIRTWSWGATDDRFPPFVAALGSACEAAVRARRVEQLHAARSLAHLPAANAWDVASPVALVGVRITIAALVVADLLQPEDRALLLAPWRAATSEPSAVRGVA